MGEIADSELEGVHRASPTRAMLPKELLGLKEALRQAHRDGGELRRAFDDFSALAFSKPEWAGEASEFIADEFEEDSEVLAHLARIPDMIIELSQGHASMTFLVASFWASKGETEPLGRLAEAMIAAHSRIQTPEGVELMLAVCTSIAVVRHTRAEQLLAAARPGLVPEHEESLADAELWLAIGRIVRTATTDERRLWDERLRRPRGQWTWDGTLERRALEHLVDHLGVDIEGAQAFRTIVPGAWWDLLVRRSRERMDAPELTMQPQEEPPVQEPVRERRSSNEAELKSQGLIMPFLAGALVGAVVVIGVSWAFPKGGLESAFGGSGAASRSSAPSWRESRRLEHEREMAELLPEIQRVKAGSWQEHSALIMGYTSKLPANGTRYRQFLEWLQIDPPRDKETREMVSSLLSQRFAGQELLDLWEGLVLDQAPNTEEIREEARKALSSVEMGQGTWSQGDIKRLRALAGS